MSGATPSSAQLPNAHNAYVADTKVRDYLLDPSHPQNSGKATFFQLFGFTQQHWVILRSALRVHPRTNPVTRVSPNPYGTRFTVRCSLLSADGRNPCITTIWVMDALGVMPELVTAFP